MKRKKNLKRIIITVVALVLVAAIGFGIWFGTSQANADPVYVYPFNYVGMTEYWGDSQESYGPVTTDKIQTVYLSDTQTVTEILVSAGDVVKKGDLLMTFDTTLSDLALERARLDVEKLKLQLEDAKDELREINSMKPMVIPSTDEEEEEDKNLGTALSGAYLISTQSTYDGSTKELALVCWLNESTNIDDALLEAIRAVAEEYQQKNAETKAEEESVPPEETQSYQVDLLSNVIDPSENATEAPTEAPTEVPTEPPAEEPAEPSPEQPTDAPEEPTVPPTDPTVPDIDVEVSSYFVVFKVTEGNMSLGQRKLWQGMEVAQDQTTGKFSFKFFDASGFADHSLAQSDQPAEEPEIDYGSGYTAAQIAEMRSQQQKTIKDLEFQIKMAEADYKIMQTEVDDGNIYAEIDGEVVSVLTEEEAKSMMQPVLKVSGGGGFYVEGSISELEKDNMEIGQEVTINDWNTGMVYTGTVESIGAFPSSDGYWNGMGNPNTSYYPFSVFIDGSADLQAGSYVSVMYSTATTENGIYLENPFLRTEKGRSFVYVEGADGKLEKRFVTTGKSLWGSYTEILSGLTAEDYVAFPYGKNVKDGAKAEQSEDYSTLYGY